MDMIRRMQLLQSTVSIKLATMCNFTSLPVAWAIVAPGGSPEFSIEGAGGGSSNHFFAGPQIVSLLFGNPKYCYFFQGLYEEPDLLNEPVLNHIKLHDFSFRQICGPQTLNFCLSCYSLTLNIDLM